MLSSVAAMAIVSRGTLQGTLSKKWKERETSPERTKVWTEPKPKSNRKVPVVYYLSRNGQLEHPHFMEVFLSSDEGFYLRDFINRLNFLRGKGVASMYSWSSKRSFKNGFVWQDLWEGDLIYPTHGQDYVLKGSLLHEPSLASGKLLESRKNEDESGFPVVRPGNLSLSALDINEYKVYKLDAKPSDASTQTDEKRRMQIYGIRDESNQEESGSPTTELSGGEISPPPSSSPETLESLMKAEGTVINCKVQAEGEISELVRTDASNHSGRIKASAVLRQLISCGSVSFREQGFPLLSSHRGGLSCGGQNQNLSLKGNCLTENKECSIGRLIENEGDESFGEHHALKRSSPYNADRHSTSDSIAQEGESLTCAKCFLGEVKTPSKRECDNSRENKRIDDAKY